MTRAETLNLINEIVAYNCSFLNPHSVPTDVIEKIVAYLADVHSVAGEGKQMIWNLFLKDASEQYRIGSYIIDARQLGIIRMRLQHLGYCNSESNRKIKVFAMLMPTHDLVELPDSEIDNIIKVNSLIMGIDTSDELVEKLKVHYTIVDTSVRK
jgi:hypothetical protein